MKNWKNSISGRAQAGAALLLALLLAGLVSSCSDDGTTEPPPPTPAFFPADYETSYVTIVDDCRVSIPHGQRIKIYASPGAATTYQDQVYDFQPGDVIVKAVYDGACATLDSFVVMKKLEQAGVDPAPEDWSWQTVLPDRTVSLEGELSDCIDCHVDCGPSMDYTCLEFP